MTFENLNLIAPILRALSDEGYTQPTPIQEQAIGPALERRDLLGCAQTGTGKTAAFATPILQTISEDIKQAPREKRRPIRALILTPTRELALQIKESFESYGRYLPLTTCVVFGGVSQRPQTDALTRGVDILVATPGRLNDLIGQGFVKLEHVSVFVLDEADRMLDMGFINDVRKILTRLPAQRQTMLFSATMPPEIEQLADTILNNPVKVAVTPPATTVELVAQTLYKTDKKQKRALLAWLLQNPEIVSALVFTRTKHGADRVARELNAVNISAQAIHGNKSQGARQLALQSFKNGDCRVLVATDIAARGIDIDELSHVVNYDLPNIPETYVHRIGRTGRAGLSGIAISFCDYDELPYLKDIEALIHQPVPVAKENPFPMSVFESAPKAERMPRRDFSAPHSRCAAKPTKPTAKPAHRSPCAPTKRYGADSARRGRRGGDSFEG